MTITIQNDGRNAYINIVPITAKFRDAVKSSELFIASTNDNGFDAATVFWELRTPAVAAVPPVYDSNGSLTQSGIPGTPGFVADFGSFEMTGDDYANWGTDNTYVFNLLLAHLGLTAA